MKIAVAAEADPSEPRVAATPETVKKMIGLGAEVAVQPGAGVKSGILDADYTAAGATVSADALSRRRCRAEGAPAGRGRACQAYKQGRAGHRHHGPLRQRGRAQGDGRCRRHRLRHGTDAAHHPRAVDGRAVEPGQSRRLSRGDRRLGRIRPRLPDDDDGGRHGAGRARLHHGRRRRRPAGDRDRAPARRGGHRDRRAPRHQGAGREPRRQIPRGRGRGVQERPDRGRLRQGNVEGVPGQAGRARRRAHQEAGHRHHHRAHSRPARRRSSSRARWSPR